MLTDEGGDYLELIVGRMKLTISIKRAVLIYNALRMSARQIALELVRLHDLNVSCQAASEFLKQYHQTHHIVRKPGSGRPSKITCMQLKQR